MTIDLDAMGMFIASNPLGASFVVGFLVVVARAKPLEIFAFSAFYMLLLLAGVLT